MNNTERDQIVALALGRIFRMAARPTQEGDGEEYERCKWLILDMLAPNEIPRADEGFDFARDYGKGAQGQW